MATQYAKDQPSGYSNHLTSIAIVGAGGQIGGHIIKELLARGKHTITAITREGSANEIPAGVKSAIVSYDDHASLVSALQGHDCLIVTLSVTAPVDTSEKLFKAAAEAKVRWVMPNMYGTDSSEQTSEPATRLQFETQKNGLAKLGLTWTGIACSFWYEFSLSGTSDRYGLDYENKKFIFYDDGEQPIHTSTFPQVGRAVTALLALPILPEDASDTQLTLSSFRDKFAHISSFRVSQKDMFASVLRVSGTKESDWAISYEPSGERFEKAKAAMMAGDRIAFGRMLYARGFFPGEFNMCNFDRFGLDNKALGLPEENLDEFTKLALEMVESGYHKVLRAKFMSGGGNQLGNSAYQKKD